jgi:RNA polymerase sigma-70 factor, ECF subfamily
MDAEPTLVLVAHLRGAHSQDAAGELFRRYSERVLRFLRPRLTARLAARVDADDVAQSVFNSFFRGVKGGGFTFHQREDVWRLLVGIAVHKLRNQYRRHHAAARSVAREADDPLTAAVARDPSPEEAAAVGDELEGCLRARTPRDREIVERFVRGEEYEAIAAAVNWSQRTVRRVCEGFVAELRTRLAAELGSTDGGAA